MEVTKFCFILLSVLLECVAARSFGHIKPEQPIRRTLFDVVHTADDATKDKHVVTHALLKNSSLLQTDQEIQQTFTNIRNKTQKDQQQNEYLDNVNPVNSDDGSGSISAELTTDGRDRKYSLNSSPSQTEPAKKKQYATDDFSVNTLAQAPVISQEYRPRPMFLPQNHVQIDPQEFVHVEPPEEHHEEPEPHIEEPVYVHHVPPPPPPPPEPVLIPVPISAPPPPPPPPPPCTVHIPVTVHLKGKLAIKMKHCENCDFSKNIEAIGPLKIAPIKGLSEKISGAIEAQAKKESELEAPQTRKDSLEGVGQSSQTENASLDPSSTGNDAYSEKTDKTDVDVSATKRNDPPVADLDEVLSKSDDIIFDEDFIISDIVRGTKKDRTEERGNKKHLVVAKPIMVPSLLVPMDAFKRGVIISLPKGKALLKCVSFVGGNDTTDSEPNDASDFTTSLADEEGGKAASYPTANNEVVTLSKPDQKVIKPTFNNVDAEKDTSDKKDSASVPLDTNERKTQPLIQPTIQNQVQMQNQQHGQYEQSNVSKTRRFTEKFLKTFDKDMLISLYKMAVGDILAELQHQKRAHRKSQILKRKIKSLQHEKSSLEKQFPGIEKSLIGPTQALYAIREDRSIDNDDDAESDMTFKNKHGKAVTLTIGKVTTSNGTRRVKLVDTYRPAVTPRPVGRKAFHNKFIPSKEDKEASNALSFYGDLDPIKLMEESPACIDAMCEKHKQFIQHAGQYFQSLDSIALEPYKKFMTEKEESNQMDNSAKVYDMSLGEVIDVRTIKNGSLKADKIHQAKRQSISDSFDSANSHMANEPTTIVELFGKLPKVPLKITLNPKGPLAKLKKPIEIDLRPPGKGDVSSRMIATANDPNVAVHVANKIFKEEPLDAKEEKKLQDVYADLKRRSVLEEKPAVKHHVYLRPQKVMIGKATPRMKIVVSLPKELQRLMSTNEGNYQGMSRSYSPQLSTSLSSIQPTYTIGQTNDDKTVSQRTSSTVDTLKPKIEEYEKTLEKLKDETKAAMAQFNRLKDPYADIGKKRSKGEKSDHKKHRKKITSDPYADLGSSVAHMEKRSVLNNELLHRGGSITAHEKIAQDPYATIGSSMSSAHKKGHFPRRRKHLEKRGPLIDLHPRTSFVDFHKRDYVNNTMLHGANNMTAYEKIAQDPYATLGSTLSSINKRENFPHRRKHLEKRESPMELRQGASLVEMHKRGDLANATMHGAENMTAYEKIAQDPYATLGSSLSSLNKKENFPNPRKHLEKRIPPVELRQGASLADSHPRSDFNNATSHGAENMTAYEKIAQDPYATIRSAVPSPNKKRHVQNRRKHLNKRRPHIQHPLGPLLVDFHKRSDFNNATLHKTKNMTTHKKIAEDPYATFRSAVPSSKEHVQNGQVYLEKRGPSVSRGRFPHRKKHLERRNHVKKSTKLFQKKGAVPSTNGVTAISLVRQQPSNDTVTTAQANVLPQTGANNAANSASQIIPETLLDGTNATALSAFPQFKEALSKISPEQRKKLLTMKPFHFLSKLNLDTLGQTPPAKDPYADMGSSVQGGDNRSRLGKKKRSKVKQGAKRSPHAIFTNENATKRSPTYDPYADLGTSIGLSQNEARRKHDEPNTEQTGNVTAKDSSARETQTKDVSEAKHVKMEPPSSRSHDNGREHQLRFVHVSNEGKSLAVYPHISVDTQENAKDHDSAGDHNVKFIMSNERNLPVHIKEFVFHNAERETSTSPAETVNTFISSDPYSDLGTSQNGDPQPYSNKTQSTPVTIKEMKPFEGKVDKIAKGDAQSNVGVTKTFTKTESSSHSDKEMEKGDLDQPVAMTATAENDLATIERLEKEIAAEKTKVEANQKPPLSVLEENVGKEIQGPYAEMGGPVEKKTGSSIPSLGDLSSIIGKINRHKKERQVIGEKKSRAPKRSLNAERKQKLTRSCLPMKVQDVMKLMKGTAEYSTYKLQSKLELIDPYASIGKNAPGKKRSYPCGVPVIKEEDAPVTQSVSSNHTTSGRDPYSEMGTSVDNITGEKKTVLAKEATDPYADLGTVTNEVVTLPGGNQPHRKDNIIGTSTKKTSKQSLRYRDSI